VPLLLSNKEAENANECWDHLNALLNVDPRQNECCAGGCLWCQNDPCDPDCSFRKAKEFRDSLNARHPHSAKTS
jgi:hypothetical protein